MLVLQAVSDGIQGPSVELEQCHTDELELRRSPGDPFDDLFKCVRGVQAHHYGSGMGFSPAESNRRFPTRA